jgi:hypothetical protein
MTNEELEKYAGDLMVLAGHAINVNDGSCGLIEDALCKTTTLCCEVLKRLEAEREDFEASQRRREACIGENLPANYLQKKLGHN